MFLKECGFFMQYKITQQYGRDEHGPQKPIAEFDQFNDAQLFIEKVKIPVDLEKNEKIIYRIFDGSMDLLKEYNPNKTDFAKTSTGETSSSASQGTSSSASFRPTPFNTAPRPTGTPQKWISDQDDKKK